MTKNRLAAEVSVLIVGSTVSGLSAYATIALGTRTYGSTAFAPVSVLWTFWALSTAMLAFPLQHWIIRQIAVDGGDGRVRGSLPRISAVLGIAAIGIGAIAFVWRGSFFGDSGAIWPLLVLGIALGSSLLGGVRGILAARRRFTALALTLALENVLRLSAAGIAVLASGSVVVFAVTLLAGPLAVLGWPGAFRFLDNRLQQPRVLGFLARVGSGTFASQIVLTSGPAALALIGGRPATITGLFVALAAFRAPYNVALGVAPRLTGLLAGLVALGRRDRLRHLAGGVVVGTLIGAAAAALLARAVGKQLIDLVFGSNVAPDSVVVAGIAAGVVVALGVLVLTLMLIAMGRPRAIVLAWGLAGIAAALPLTSGTIGPLQRVLFAFITAEVTAFAVIGLSSVRQIGGSDSGDEYLLV